MLTLNGAYHRITPQGGALRAIGFWRNSRNQRLLENRRFGADVSAPQGYQSAAVALIPTFATSGQIAARLVGASDLTANLTAIGNMTATLTGEGSFSAAGNMAANIYATLTGEGSVTATLRALGNMSATLDAGARPSAFDIAQEVWQTQAAAVNSAGTVGEKLNDAGGAANPWNEVIESGYTAAEILRLLAAHAAGAATGLEGATPRFKSLDGTKTRIDGTYAAGERGITDLDAS